MRAKNQNLHRYERKDEMMTWKITKVKLACHLLTYGLEGRFGCIWVEYGYSFPILKLGIDFIRYAGFFLFCSLLYATRNQ